MAALPPYATTGQRVWYYSFRVICTLLFLFLIIPILVILPLSFNAEDFFTFTKKMLALDPDGYSLKHYRDFFTNSDWQNALYNSARIAPMATSNAPAAVSAAISQVAVGESTVAVMISGIRKNQAKGLLAPPVRYSTAASAKTSMLSCRKNSVSLI